jgi:four helix bundle protein
MQNYKDLKVWQKAHAFTLKIYTITQSFPKQEMYGITNQIRRSSSSVPANIAEGCGKLTQNDFARFLQIALGSANETEYFLILSFDLKYINNEQEFNELLDNINEIKAMLISLVGRVRAKLTT